MGEIVNLRRVKKQAAKLAGEAQAAINRAAHGRTRAERDAEAQREALRQKLLDGARRE